MAIAGAISFGLVSILCSRFASWLLRTTTPISLPLAFCSVIALETLVLNTLSVFRLVTAPAVLVCHVLIATAGIVLGRRRGGAGTLGGLFDLARIRHRVTFALRSSISPYLLPMLALLYFVALVYPSNNYDSMTYHMARVVFWIQERSVDFYPTINHRQNGLGPGAEYLILILQLFSGGDWFANSVQTVAFSIIVVSITLIARCFGAPRAFRTPLVVLFCTAPMFVLQATSTQNDMCAAVGGLAIVSSLRRVLFARKALLSIRDAVALAVAIAVSYLIKPTALMIIAFLVLVAGCRVLWTLIRWRREINWRVTASAAGIAVVVLLGLAGPHLLRIAADPRSMSPVANMLFPNTSTLGLTWHRLLNPLFIASHHIPVDSINRSINKLYKQVEEPVAAFPWWLGKHNFGHALRQYEDLAGAPLQFLATFLLSGFGVVWAFRRGPPVRSVALRLVLLPPGCWLFFHWVSRNNVWIARYHCVWFAMAVISAFGVCQFARKNRAALVGSTLAAWVFALPAYVYAWSTIMVNEIRPVSTKAFINFDRVASYYAHRPDLKPEHDRVLKALEKESCTELVLALGNEDEIEYPLTWRALQAGVHIYHRPGPPSACMLYAPHGLTSAAWKPLRRGETKLFVPRYP